MTVGNGLAHDLGEAALESGSNISEMGDFTPCFFLQAVPNAASRSERASPFPTKKLPAKQQFVVLLSETNKHIILYLISHIFYLNTISAPFTV